MVEPFGGRLEGGAWDVDAGAAGALDGEDEPAQDGGVAVALGLIAGGAGEHECDGILRGAGEDGVVRHGEGFAEGDGGDGLAVHGFAGAEVALLVLAREEPGEGALHVVAIGTLGCVGVTGAEVAEEGHGCHGGVGFDFGGVGAVVAAIVEVLGTPMAVGVLVAGEPVEGEGDGAFGFFGAAHFLEEVGADFGGSLGEGFYGSGGLGGQAGVAGAG